MRILEALYRQAGADPEPNVDTGDAVLCIRSFAAFVRLLHRAASRVGLYKLDYHFQPQNVRCRYGDDRPHRRPARRPPRSARSARLTRPARPRARAVRAGTTGSSTTAS